MGLRIIYGKPGSGKSTYCFQEISKLINKEKKIFIITPEQFSFTAERKLMENVKSGAVINAEVITLSRMAYRVLKEVGGNDKSSLSKCGKAMLIYSILSTYKKELKFLGKSDENIDLTMSAIAEFKKHGVTVDDLKNEINDLEKSKNSMNSNIILNKKEELKILENQKQKYYTENISPTSGIVSFEYDNDYEKVKLDKLDDINSNILDSLENNFIKIKSNSHKVSSSEVALRIINPNETYICIFQNKDKNHFKEAQDLKIISNGQAIKAKIDKIYEKKDEDVIVIKIMEQNMSIYNTRVQEFDIIYKNIKGFKIPVESVVEKNNKLGVYVINEENNIPEFVSLGKNYYKDAKYYYVDYNKNKDENKLNLYDRILLYPNFINKNIKVSR